MRKVTVTENAIRELIRGAFDGRGMRLLEKLADPQPIKVNDVVDPSAAVTDPDNEDFRPTTPAEFQVAVKTLVEELPSDKIADTYEKLVKALNQPEDKDKKMKKDTKAEAFVRSLVRRTINESLEDEMPLPKVPRKYAGAVNTPGGGLEAIAKRFGLSTSGAKGAVDKALSKAQWSASMQFGSPEEMEEIVLTAVKDYIDFLKGSGELEPAEVKLLKDNPGIVSSLDGFREFLHSYIKRARKQRPEGVPMKKGDIPWTNRGE
jgi:hypothetical protein